MGIPTVQVTPAGITAPSYADILAALQTAIRQIYGVDIYIDPDSQDGQLLAIFAQALYDVSQQSVLVFNAFSPATAFGVGLSSVVKINGISRHISSQSSVTVTVIGQQGTQINNGIIGDSVGLGTRWALPPSVTIPFSGTIDVTALCTSQGNVDAAPNTITRILTPTLGWQTVNNAGAAIPGAPVETDAQLRQRQALSTSIPALSVLDAIFGGLATLDGVQRLLVYENDTGAFDSNGLPPHSISAVLEGGDAQTIANTIARYKCPGTGTFGDVTETTLDSRGIPNIINFFYLRIVQLDVEITIEALAGYVSTTGDLLKQAVAAFITGLDIGEKSYTNRLYGPANLDGDVATTATGQSQAILDMFAKTYNVSLIRQCRHGGSLGTGDITLEFNAAAACVIANITLIVS